MKKIKLSDIKKTEFKKGDFVFLIYDYEDLINIPVDNLMKSLEQFENKLPEGVSYALIPQLSAFLKTPHKDVVKSILDSWIDNYNKHFNDIYVPYAEDDYE